MSGPQGTEAAIGPACPSFGSHAVAEIVYGLVFQDDELDRQLDSGDDLFGDLVEEDQP